MRNSACQNEIADQQTSDLVALVNFLSHRKQLVAKLYSSLDELVDRSCMAEDFHVSKTNAWALLNLDVYRNGISREKHHTQAQVGSFLL